MNKYHKVVLTQIVAKWVFLDLILSVSLLNNFASILKNITLYLESLQDFVAPKNLNKIVIVLGPDSWVTNYKLSKRFKLWFNGIEDVRAVNLKWTSVFYFKPPKWIKLGKVSLPRCLEITTDWHFSWYC